MSGFGERLNQRQKNFKKATDADEARRKREDAAVQLRKQVKEEALLKKRMVNEEPTPAAVNPFATPDQDGMAMAGARTGANAQVLENLPAMVQALSSDDFDMVFNATQQFRKLLSIEVSPPIAEVINAGIMPRFVQLLKEVSKPNLQFEAAWVLTNIASGTADQTAVVVQHGALPLFVELLQSPNEDVREQAAWALGNIAGDCPTFRDLVLQSGALVPIMKLLSEAQKPSLLRNATWTLSNLCRGKPPPPLEWVTPALPTFVQLLNSMDNEVLTDASWALSYLSDGPNERISAVIQSGVCPRLVELLSHTSPLVQTPALRASGNIVTGDDTQTGHMLQCGLLQPLHGLLSHVKKSIRKEACWTISNITAGSKPQIQEVMNNGLIPPVLAMLQTSDFDIKREAAWAISNACAGGSKEQIQYLVECGCIKPLCELMTCQDAKMASVALDGLECILKIGKQVQNETGAAENHIVTLVEQCDGMDALEALQQDANEDVYSKAVRILSNYFPLDSDNLDCVDDQSTWDNPASSGFGLPVPQGGFNFS